jgi:hypothetical protein
MGKTKKNGKKIMQLKWPKYQKPKDRIWDERNIYRTMLFWLLSDTIRKIEVFGMILTIFWQSGNWYQIPQQPLSKLKMKRK